VPESLEELLVGAIERRRALLERLHAEGTDCYRLFHGVAEGRPGLTIDRYGPVLLLQTWREPLTPAEIGRFGQIVRETCGLDVTPVWNHRGPDRGAQLPYEGAGPVIESPELDDAPIGAELGLRYHVTPRHRGQDPLLFLDLRAGRRRVRDYARGKSVLNLFAYTGGVGLCALKGGADEVWNVDFARSSLAWAEKNLVLNGLGGDRVRMVREDVVPVLRQLAGLPVKGRGAQKRSFQSFEPRRFDLVVLDPPRWAKGPFGAIDIVRDYPSLLKPALLATAPGGSLLLTHNAARVGREDWVAILRRTAEKFGRPFASLELFEPEEDFPSLDGEPPLKLAWVSL